MDIIKTYGINKKGRWETEVLISYIEVGSDIISYSIGKTSIDFE
ncbi:hypothetical protein C5S35_05300 [Candidatus Methanophagaceae archaeon]|nr:hypothetical protein C5S35_05300 [Methanophagales archaeon]